MGTSKQLNYAPNVGAMGILQCASILLDHDIAPGQGSAGTIDIVALPAGCLVDHVLVNVREAFNASSNTLEVGYGTTPNQLVSAGDVNEGATGLTTVNNKLRTTAATTIKAKYTQGGSPAASAGYAEISVFFSRIATV